MTTTAPMATGEYQALIEDISTVAGQLETLGETRSEWTADEQDAWNELDKRYEDLIERKASEDDKREAARVEERMQEIKRPQRNVPVSRSFARKRREIPNYLGKLRAFRGERGAEDAYDVGLWLKASLLNDRASRDLLEVRQPEWRAQTEGTTTAGGFTVPDPLSNALIQVISEVSVAMKVCRVWPMTSDTLKVPRLTAGMAVAIPGEATAISPLDVTFAQVSLTAIKRATLTLISNELVADSLINMADTVAERAAYELAFQMDEDFLDGDGQASPHGSITGLSLALSGTGTAGLTTMTGNTWAETTLAELLACKGKLPGKYYQEGMLSWIMRRDYYAQGVEPLLYAAGGNVPQTIGAGAPASLFGYPVYFSDKMPAAANDAAVAFFGNFQQGCALGLRTDVSVATSTDYAFNLDALAVRAIFRYDISNFDMGDGSNAGAFVGLRLAAS